MKTTLGMSEEPIAGVVLIGSGKIKVTRDSIVKIPSFLVNFSGNLSSSLVSSEEDEP